MKKVVITTFYFGKEPWYLKYFIQSCIDNKDVDFIFFTDIKDFTISASNVEIIKISFEEFSLIISKFLNIELDIKTPIKLCDIRPSFGEVFQYLIKDYDFWGYCDIDLVFGRIRYFLNEEVLSKFDVIFSKHEYPSGFFAIYRNNIKVNSLYRSSNDYIKVFQSDHLHLFDECGGYYDAVCNGINILETDYDIDSMHHILERNKDEVNILYEFYSLESSIGEIKYVNGVLTYKNQFEILLYHFTTFKNNYFFNEAKHKAKSVNKTFYIGKFEISNLNNFSIIFNKTISTLKPLIKKILMKLDFKIGNLINIFNIKSSLKTGKYIYMKRELIIELDKNDYFIIHPDGSKNKIFFLFFLKNVFYEKSKFQYYLMSELNNNIYTAFSLIFDNGTIMKYKNNQ